MISLPGYVIAEKDEEVRKAAKESIMTQASEHLTICEQLRFIYDTVCLLPDGEIKQDLETKIVDAFIMGKKMNSRLQRYKREYNDKTGSAGSNLIRLQYKSEREKLRNERNK